MRRTASLIRSWLIAPDFSYGTSMGETRTLGEYRDNRIVLLVLPGTLGARDRLEQLTAELHRLWAAGIETIVVPGALGLLQNLHGSSRIGIATANLLGAAELRLKDAGLWDHVSACAHAADGGGHKRQILARAMAATGLPKDRIVYIGDNLNDVEAGLSNGVHFIGFSTDSGRLTALKRAGASHTSNNHLDSFRLIGHLLQRESKRT